MRPSGAVLAVALTLALLGSVAPVSATPRVEPARSPYVFTDPRDDAGGAKSDVLTVVVDNGPRITVTVRMGDAIPFSQWGDRITGLAVFFSPKTLMEITRTRSVFGLGGPTSVCPVRREYQPVRERYVFSMARSCLRDPATVRVLVQTTRRGDSLADSAPRTGFSRPVAER